MQKKQKYTVLAAMAVTAFDIAFGMLTCGWLFKWIYRLSPIPIWRPVQFLAWQYWVMVDIGIFVISIIYVMAYAKIGCVLGKSKIERGLRFGFYLWFVAMLPGMFYLYTFINIHPWVVVYWLIRGFIEFIVAGLLIAWIYSLSNEQSCCK